MLTFLAPYRRSPSFLRALLKGRDKRRIRRRVGEDFAPAAEVLEDRTLLSTLVVTTPDDVVDDADGVLSLREAIQIANDSSGATSFDGISSTDVADLIVFDDAVFNAGAASDTITLNGTRLPIITQELAIDGMIDGGNARVILDGNLASRILQVDTRVPVDLVNLVIRNGSEAAGSGGGIFNSGTLTITGSTLSGNSAMDDGGAIFNDRDGVLTITGTALSDNSADVGGAINTRGALTIVDSMLLDNSARVAGAIRTIGADAIVMISGSTISGNRANNVAGAISIGSGTVLIIDSTLSGNRDDVNGGARA